jgi:hypothetical protein
MQPTSHEPLVADALFSHVQAPYLLLVDIVFAAFGI